MKLVKHIAVATLLFGVLSTAHAEEGYERAKNFQENFRAEQARLWSDHSSDQNKPQIAQEQRQEQSPKEQADN